VPERTYLEAWGYEVVSPTFGVPAVSSQQPVRRSFNDIQSPADVLLAVAKNIPAAAAAMNWSDEVAFLKETIARLPAGAAGGSGADLLWARFLQHGGWWPAQLPAPPAARLPRRRPSAYRLPSRRVTRTSSPTTCMSTYRPC